MSTFNKVRIVLAIGVLAFTFLWMVGVLVRGF